MPTMRTPVPCLSRFAGLMLGALFSLSGPAGAQSHNVLVIIADDLGADSFPLTATRGGVAAADAEHHGAEKQRRAVSQCALAADLLADAGFDAHRAASVPHGHRRAAHGRDEPAACRRRSSRCRRRSRRMRGWATRWRCLANGTSTPARAPTTRRAPSAAGRISRAPSSARCRTTRRGRRSRTT